MGQQRRVWLPYLLSFIVLALLGGACATPTAPGAVDQDGTKSPKRGGTLTRHATASMAGADPAMGQNAYQMWNYIGTFIVRREPDTWKLAPDAVERWEFSPDGLELTLHVRQGFKWEHKPPVNGREIEARDIAYTLRSITGLQYPELPPLRFPRRSNLEDMADAVAVDKYTVKVRLKHPSATFLDGLAEFRSPITPDKIREHFGDRDSLANPSPERYFSAGPFVLTQFQDTVEAIYSRYPDYWEKAEDGQSKPYLDAVREIWIPDQGTAIAAFLAGQLDILALGNPEDRNLILSQRKETRVITYSPESCWYRMAFNMSRKPFDDVRVRRAFSLVLDPVETGKTLWGDWETKPIWRYPGPLPWAYPEALSQEELAQLPFYESPKSPRTIEEAKRLMAEAGITSLEFEMMSSTGTIKDAAQLAIHQINRVFPNIKIKAAPLDNALQLERAAKGDFDVQYYCYIHEPTAVAHLKTAFHSKGGRNSARLNDAKMDELLDRAGKELDREKRNQLLRESQSRVLELVSMMPTAHYASQMGTQPYVRGMRLGGGTRGYGIYAKEIWFDK
ncbi:MAG: hypothetical protein HYY02_07900 [Chloroflexi bacterium]|nr:hypothetical protein [Chloroflexota bacterium]